MQSTVAQVFTVAQLENLSIDAFRSQLGGKKYFRIEGVSRIYSAHVLTYIETLTDLAPTLTIAHASNTYHLSRKLWHRISASFRHQQRILGGDATAVSYTVKETISKRGLEHIIDTAHGRGQHLEGLDDSDLDNVIIAANAFKVQRVLRTASRILRTKAEKLNVQDLVALSSRVNALSEDFKTLFSPFFSIHLQRLILRSQYVAENDLQSLITHLAQFEIPLALEFKHWRIDSNILPSLAQLRITKLNLLFCYGTINLTQFNYLNELRGSNANFSNLSSCKHLKLLNVDGLPSKLPRSLRELTLRDAAPTPSQLPRKLNRLSLHRQLDTSELSALSDEKVKSLRLTSRSGSIPLDTILQIHTWNLTQLTLINVSMPPDAAELPVLNTLREATVQDCDLETLQWVLSSTGLTKVHLKVDEDKALTSLPPNLTELTLNFNGPASSLSKLSSLARLTSLRLSDIKWTEGGLESLSSLTSLRDLSIRMIGAFLPGNTEALTQLPLRSFSFESSHASCFPQTAKELNDLAKLSTLRLLKIRPFESLLPSLVQLTHLEGIEILDLFGTSKLEWSHIPRLTSLKELRLRGCRWITLDPNSDLSGVPNLRHLEIPQLQGDKAHLFERLTSLETLILDE